MELKKIFFFVFFCRQVAERMEIYMEQVWWSHLLWPCVALSHSVNVLSLLSLGS